MKRLFAVLLLGLIVVALPFGCNGDAVTDPGNGRREPALTPIPGNHHQRPTPGPCGPKPPQC